LLHFVRGVGPLGPSHPSFRDNDGGSRTSLRGNAVTAAIYSELHNLRIEQAKLFIQSLDATNKSIESIFQWILYAALSFIIIALALSIVSEE
jgi:hypothetical protein